MRISARSAAAAMLALWFLVVIGMAIGSRGGCQ